MTSPYDIFIFAGEPSGDILGKDLITELKKQNPNSKIAAVAGKNMRQCDLFCLLPMEKFLVMGFLGIITSIFSLIKHFFFLRRWILQNNPKVLIFIDYQEFNLLIERALRKKGFKGKIVHYVSPSVWAWRKKRIQILEKNCDLLLTLFPFEKAYYKNTKLDVQYIGHPLAYKILQSSSSSKPKDAIGLFPGSRKKEVEKNFPLQLQAVQHLLQENKNLQVYISVASTKLKPLIEKIIKKSSYIKRIHLWDKSSYDMMAKIQIALATSGTINLELALHQIPTIVTYHLGKIDTFIGKHIAKILLPFYCIVNICMGKEIFWELYGPHLSQQKLAFLTRRLYQDKDLQQKCKKHCLLLQKKLYKPEPSSFAAQAINNYL